MSRHEVIANARAMGADARAEELRAAARGDLMEAAYWAEVADNCDIIEVNMSASRANVRARDDVA